MNYASRLPPLSAATENRLLNALPPAERACLARHLTPVTLVPHQVLQDVDQPVEHAWFVESGLVSLMTNSAPEAIEVAMIGREGMVGDALVLEQSLAAHTAVAQIGGAALRIPAAVLIDLLPELPELHRLLARNAHALYVQSLQAAACNAKHRVEQRLAKWLLLALDRSGLTNLPLTHDFLGQMLGVRRASVTDMLHILEGEKMLRSTRGMVAIRDRARLETAACGCYRVLASEADKVFEPKD